MHAFIAPSFLATIIKCPGAAAMARDNPSPETDESREGTVAHLVAQNAVTKKSIHYVGQTIDGVTIDEDMIRGAEMYADAIGAAQGHAEMTMPIRRIHQGFLDMATGELTEACFGTPDYWQWSKASRTLTVTDYKYGHLYVEVIENWQLMAYAAGILDYLREQGENTEGVTIVLRIVQPRCFTADEPVREWWLTESELRLYMNKAAHAAALACAPNLPTVAGPHCLFCPARSVCKTANEAGSAIVEWSGRVETTAATPESVGVRLRLIDDAMTVLKGLKTGLEEHALTMIRAGKTVPYWSIGYSKPRQTWSKPPQELKLLGDMFGVPLVELQPAMTPKQAIAKKIPEKIVAEYSTTPAGKARLEPDDTVKFRQVFKR